MNSDPLPTLSSDTISERGDNINMKLGSLRVRRLWKLTTDQHSGLQITEATQIIDSLQSLPEYQEPATVLSMSKNMSDHVTLLEKSVALPQFDHSIQEVKAELTPAILSQEPLGS